jgi:alpha,alpha-trehalase
MARVKQGLASKKVLIKSLVRRPCISGFKFREFREFFNPLFHSTSLPLERVLLWTLMLSLASSAVTASAPDRASPAQLQSIRTYIKDGWHNLTRSNSRLAQAAIDPKFPQPAGGRWPVYICAKEDLQQVQSSLKAVMSPDDFASIELRKLPAGAREVKEQGLLYLPHPYVVPGGRFNEMYGWDSYFIQVGLLRDGENDLARDMVDNFLYEVVCYGKVLNANRTYYLSRSQPPFLTEMILAVYRKTHDLAWLKTTVPAIEKYYRYWMESPHLTAETGLSRYYDSGTGPAPEAISAERDQQGRTHYDRARQYYKTHEVTDYDERRFYDRKADQLTPLFFTGDRSMRESGFDPSNRYGPFSVDIIDYNPVCLNSLLYLMEAETVEIMRILGRSHEAAIWLGRAVARKQAINRLMWDERDGLYYDYNFAEKRLRRYAFITTFYPLWAGIASRSQAARVVANLPIFERPGGLQTSATETSNQWDAPFGWAPMQMIAVAGLRRYGYAKEADRIAANFLSMILKEFIAHNAILEKYDVSRRRSDVSAGIKFGYGSNEIGFGWTNAAFLDLYAGLSPGAKVQVLNIDSLDTGNPASIIPPSGDGGYFNSSLDP